MLQARQARAHLADFAACAGSSQKTSRASECSSTCALLGRIGVVDRRDDRPGAQRAEVAQCPFRSGRAEDRDAVARLDPERDQSTGDLPGHVADLA